MLTRTLTLIHTHAHVHSQHRQGSRIAHTVTPVISGREARVSAVYSFQSRNAFAKDNYLFNTFVRIKEPDAILQSEHARHAAWRVRGHMDFFDAEPLGG